MFIINSIYIYIIIYFKIHIIQQRKQPPKYTNRSIIINEIFVYGEILFLFTSYNMQNA